MPLALTKGEMLMDALAEQLLLRSEVKHLEDLLGIKGVGAYYDKSEYCTVFKDANGLTVATREGIFDELMLNGDYIVESGTIKRRKEYQMYKTSILGKTRYNKPVRVTKQWKYDKRVSATRRFINAMALEFGDERLQY